MKDVQNLKDNRNVDIQKVGINHLDLPLTIQILKVLICRVLLKFSMNGSTKIC